jgi:hypothetical protein
MSLPSTRARPGRPVEGLPIRRRALAYAAEHAAIIPAGSEAVNVFVKTSATILRAASLKEDSKRRWKKMHADARGF